MSFYRGAFRVVLKKVKMLSKKTNEEELEGVGVGGEIGGECSQTSHNETQDTVEEVQSRFEESNQESFPKNEDISNLLNISNSLPNPLNTIQMLYSQRVAEAADAIESARKQPEGLERQKKAKINMSTPMKLKLKKSDLSGWKSNVGYPGMHTSEEKFSKTASESVKKFRSYREVGHQKSDQEAEKDSLSKTNAIKHPLLIKFAETRIPKKRKLKKQFFHKNRLYRSKDRKQKRLKESKPFKNISDFLNEKCLQSYKRKFRKKRKMQRKNLSLFVNNSSQVLELEPLIKDTKEFRAPQVAQIPQIPEKNDFFTLRKNKNLKKSGAQEDPRSSLRKQIEKIMTPRDKMIEDPYGGGSFKTKISKSGKTQNKLSIVVLHERKREGKLRAQLKPHSCDFLHQKKQKVEKQKIQKQRFGQKGGRIMPDLSDFHLSQAVEMPKSVRVNTLRVRQPKNEPKSDIIQTVQKASQRPKKPQKKVRLASFDAGTLSKDKKVVEEPHNKSKGYFEDRHLIDQIAEMDTTRRSHGTPRPFKLPKLSSFKSELKKIRRSVSGAQKNSNGLIGQYLAKKLNQRVRFQHEFPTREGRSLFQIRGIKEKFMSDFAGDTILKKIPKLSKKNRLSVAL